MVNLFNNRRARDTARWPLCTERDICARFCFSACCGRLVSASCGCAKGRTLLAKSRVEKQSSRWCEAEIGGVTMARKRGKERDVLDAFLRPVQIALDLLGGLHAVGEIGARAFETALGERLQFEQFAVFRVEFAGSVSQCVSQFSTIAFSLHERKRLVIDSVREREREGAKMKGRRMGILRLRLPRQPPIQRNGIEGAIQAIAQHLDEIDAAGCGGGRFVFAARATAAAAGGGGVVVAGAVGGGDGGVGAGAGDGGRRHGDSAAVGLGRGVGGFAGHVEREGGWLAVGCCCGHCAVGVVGTVRVCG